ncbi:MAG: sulfite exporter TauE/SafE family protein, partial [Thermoanaerobaculia bacterium]
MNETLPLLAAAGAGLLGAGHCLGMCGGIAGALSIGVPTERRTRIGGLLPWQLAYNAGRIATYAALGALAGGAGSAVGALLPPLAARYAGRLLAALFLIGMGLYLVGRPALLAPIEHLGARLWRLVEPLGRRLLR